MAKDLRNLAPRLSDPADDIVPVPTGSVTDIVGRAVLVTGNAGDVVMVTAAGNTRTVPFLKGQQLDVMITRITAASTATGIMVLT